ncbi:thiol-disulfide oxidoreductase DCC family protein [Pseudalkalibacillus decolorationis]|uniref:thiol-disulfide oxidoreductase DCC family protein n=1 Tax=Pseudalkalibacillus decolorationis TaxID=163879 RepID=UPI002147246D|nr:thiol-disulfide oxidoreductase DCC family protein [Pseudalkalibacillus decolorationis]
MSAILLFDGECNLCNGIVQFVIKRDPNAYYRFASLQSEAGQELLSTYNLPNSLDTFILIENEQAYQRSDAALRVCKHLNGGWKILSKLFWIPRPVRDTVYSFIAKNRYKWFGKRESCMIPTPSIKKRFLS